MRWRLSGWNNAEGNDVIELAGGFSAVDEAGWMEAAEAALKGRPFDRLRSQTIDGLPIEPIYRGRRDASALAGRAAGMPWTVVARVELPDPAQANALLLEDLENGAGGLSLVFAPSKHARGAGLSIDTLAEMDRLLENVLLDLIHIRIDGGYVTRSSLALLVALAERRGIDPSALQVTAEIDPIGGFAQKGWTSGTLEAMAPRLWDLVHYCEDIGLKGALTSADGRIWHAAGASEAQELAYTLATAVTYLREIDRAGRDGLQPQSRVSVAMAADADQFATIAKLRAMRKLWARVLDACGLEQTPLEIHAETAWRMMTRRDPWVNMLRTTVAAFAAGVGGADSVSVLPFTEALGVPDSFARRVARNTQTILIEESNLHRVADPAAGSGAVEALTDELVREAWKLFQGVEAEGGIEQCVRYGSVHTAIARSRAARSRLIASRRAPLTGTSSFPNLAEKPVRVLTFEPHELGVSTADIVLPKPGHGELTAALVDAAKSGVCTVDLARARDELRRVDGEPLPTHRLAEPFEALRDASDAWLNQNGRRPSVLLANFGRVTDFTARSTWAKNFFEAGGIEAQASEALTDGESAAAALRGTAADIVCLCSSDALYAEQAVEMAEALKGAGAAHVYLAGKLADDDGKLAEAGVEAMLYEGCDVLAMLGLIHANLGLCAPAEGA